MYHQHQSFICMQLNEQTVLFLTIQSSVSHLFWHSVEMSNSSIWPKDWTLSGATTPGPSGPRNDGNKGVVGIHKSFRITGASPSECLMSYLGHTFSGVGSYASAEILSVYSTAPTDWVIQTSNS